MSKKVEYLCCVLHKILEYFFAEEKINLKQHEKTKTYLNKAEENLSNLLPLKGWLETTGDLDDFIFYQSEQKVSQR